VPAATWRPSLAESGEGGNHVSENLDVEAGVDLGCESQEHTFGEVLREQVDVDEVLGGSPVEEREHLTSSKVLRAEGGPSAGYGPRLMARDRAQAR
jgi:hypothetical protein